MSDKPVKAKSGDLSPRTQYLIERHGIIWLIWGLLCFLNWMRLGPLLMRGELQENDDYMRLAQIRDWLGGQGWSDLHQYRLNPVDPIVMHWSRISDVLIGGPIKLLTPLIGAQKAEVFMLAAYPSLILLVFLYLVVTLTTKLTDNARAPMAAAFMAALSYAVLAQFSIGHIDHHGLQIIMALACLWCIIKSATVHKYALFAGILCGLGLYVGIESAPYIAAACICIVLVWIFKEPHSESRMRRFGLGMAATTVVSLGLSAPASLWFTPSCDAISVVYTQLTLAVALLLWGLGYVGRKVSSPLLRFIIAGGLALVALAATMVLFPHCLQGPYSELDPRLTEIWLANVSEAKPFHAYFRNHIVGGTAMILLPVFTLIGFALYHRKTGNGLGIAPRSLIIFMVLALMAGSIQSRLMAFSASFAIPFAAYLLVYGLEWAETLKSIFMKNLARIGCLILLAPITIPMFISLFASSEMDTEADIESATLATQCLNPKTLGKLNALPEGTALTQIDMGAAILVHARNISVTSAPYHRNANGILAALDMFMGDEDTAHAAVRTTKAKYVIACANSNETGMYLNYAPTGMMSKLKAGQHPAWLEPIEIDPSHNILVYEVKH